MTTYDYTKQVGHLLRRAYQRHVAIFQQIIPDEQLTAAQYVTLCALLEKQPCSLNDVVRATAIDQGTARGVVERLGARKLIMVKPDEIDKRKVLISLTGQGERLVKKMQTYGQEISDITMSSLNPAERVALIYLLSKISEPGKEAASD